MNDLLETGEMAVNTPSSTEQLADSTGGRRNAIAIAKLIHRCIGTIIGQTATGRSTRSSRRELRRERFYAVLLGVFGVSLLFVAASLLFALIWWLADARTFSSVDRHYSNGTYRTTIIRRSSTERQICTLIINKCIKAANCIAFCIDI